MTQKEKNELIDALVEFCKRVANGKATSAKEIEVLPQVAKMLVEYPVTRNEKQ